MVAGEAEWAVAALRSPSSSRTHPQMRPQVRRTRASPAPTIAVVEGVVIVATTPTRVVALERETHANITITADFRPFPFPFIFFPCPFQSSVASSAGHDFGVGAVRAGRSFEATSIVVWAQCG